MNANEHLLHHQFEKMSAMMKELAPTRTSNINLTLYCLCPEANVNYAFFSTIIIVVIVIIVIVKMVVVLHLLLMLML